MSVYLTIIGNHSIPFKNKELEDKSKLIDLLNSLKLEESSFLKEELTVRYSSNKHCNSSFYSWSFIENEDDYSVPCSDSEHYELKGPFGLELEINKHFFVFDRWRYSWYYWFIESNEIFLKEWRQIISKTSKILGGDYVMYFPDNLLGGDLANYSPDNWAFPKGIEANFQTKIKDLNQLIEFISQQWSKPFTFAEGYKEYLEGDKVPFILDRFEDLDK
ncbi:MAG: hypothetical protein GX879_10805 [Bacteroidales bacterium]|nr:hypothetical protein [Bacteroidales bacterium]